MPCTVTPPGVAGLVSPANNSTVNSTTVNLQWNNPSSYGTGCPNTINNNRVFVSLNCNGTYTDESGPIGINNTFTLSGLNWNTTYCWRVQTSNSSADTFSAVFRFTIPPISTLQADSVFGDVCGNGITGRISQPGTSNPITFNYAFSNPGGNYNEAWLAFVPSTGPYAENRDTVDADTVNAKALNADGIVVRQIRSVSPNQVSILLPSPTRWSAGRDGSPGNESIPNFPNNTIVVTSINSATNTSQTGTLNASFQLQINENLLSGNYNVYGLVITENGGVSRSSHATGSQNIYKLLTNTSSWTIDNDAPSVSVVGPSVIGPNQFSMNYIASDPNGIQENAGYIYSDVAGARLDDNAGNIITTGTTPLTYPTNTQNAGIPQNSPLNVTGTYTDLDPGLNAQYVFRLYSVDNACNVAETTQSATIIQPWLISYDNTISANGGFNSITIPDVSGYTVPFTSDIGTPFLNNFGVISGNANVPTTRSSRTNTIANNYDNLASTLPEDSGESTWYEHLQNLALENATNSLITSSASTFSGQVSASLGISQNDQYIIQISNNLTIDEATVCDIQGLFFVNGDISVSPDLTKLNNQNGCLFVANGSVVIEPGNTKTNTSLTSATLSSYDIIEAGFIANSFTVNADTQGANNKWDGLYVDGLVYSPTTLLNRDLNSTANNELPAHMFRYDASLYYLFRDDLAKRSYSVREIIN